MVNSGSDAPPTTAAVERLADLDAQLEEVYAKLQEILDTEVVALNEMVAAIELPAVVLKQE